MRFFGEPIEFEKQAGIGSPVWRGRADGGEALQAFAVAAHRNGGRFAALWGEDRRKCGEGFRLLEAAVGRGDDRQGPDLAMLGIEHHPPAQRPPRYRALTAVDWCPEQRTPRASSAEVECSI